MYVDRRYIPLTETAKLIRAVLKASFPGVKFSVKSHGYAGGASIYVRWTDGPLGSQVEGVTKGFQAVSHIDVSDLAHRADNRLNGEAVRFGADYVFTYRTAE